MSLVLRALRRCKGHDQLNTVFGGSPHEQLGSNFLKCLDIPSRANSFDRFPVSKEDAEEMNIPLEPKRRHPLLCTAATIGPKTVAKPPPTKKRPRSLSSCSPYHNLTSTSNFSSCAHPVPYQNVYQPPASSASLAYSLPSSLSPYHITPSPVPNQHHLYSLLPSSLPKEGSMPHSLVHYHSTQPLCTAYQNLDQPDSLSTAERLECNNDGRFFLTAPSSSSAPPPSTASSPVFGVAGGMPSALPLPKCQALQSAVQPSRRLQHLLSNIVSPLFREPLFKLLLLFC